MMGYRKSAWAAAVWAVAVLVLVAGCSSGPKSPETSTGPGKGPIIVGSKIDTEGELLASMIQIRLESAGFEVVDRSQTGTTEVVRNALLTSQIDIYPEYTGSGLIFFEGQDPSVYKDGERGYAAVKRLDLEQNSVVWLAPARANNTWAIATRRDFAQKHGLASMSDMAEYVNSGGAVKLAGSAEFFGAVDAMPAFESTYGFSLREDQHDVVGGGNTTQTEKAVADKTGGVNFGMAYGTDGAIADLGLLVLEDDKRAQLVYWPAPIVRKPVLEKYPEIATLLDPVFKSLTLERLQRLNARIQVNGEPASTVARDYLAENHFIE